MRLNTLSPGKGAKRQAKRVGRGMAAGNGKTCGRGHKGQGSRKSPGPRPGFEGGQMPMQRRLPKFGFTSTTAHEKDQIRTSALIKCEGDVIDIEALRSAGLIGKRVKSVKVIASGEVGKAVTLKGLGVTKGARALVEGAGGKIEA